MDTVCRPSSSDETVRESPPSVSRQKTYIVENAIVLDADTKKAILRIVMMEVGQTAPNTKDPQGPGKQVVLVNKATGFVSIHLDNIDNAEVVLHIYNIVSNRRSALCEPANGGKRL